MKSSLAINLFIFLVFWTLSGESKTPSASPVKSKEEVVFTSKKDLKLLDMGKSDYFQGVLSRSSEKDIRDSDLYIFPDEKSIYVTSAMCQKWIEHILGPLNQTTLKLEKLEIFASHTGKTCDGTLLDPDKESKIPERRIIAGFLNGHPTALVFKLGKRTSAKETQEMRLFWDTLR